MNNRYIRQTAGIVVNNPCRITVDVGTHYPLTFFTPDLYHTNILLGKYRNALVCTGKESSFADNVYAVSLYTGQSYEETNRERFND